MYNVIFKILQIPDINKSLIKNQRKPSMKNQGFKGLKGFFLVQNTK